MIIWIAFGRLICNLIFGYVELGNIFWTLFMKIHLLSDLHLEFFGYDVSGAGLDADVIVLAGDIGVGSRGLEWAMRLLDRTDAHILYLCGNHEFYHRDINTVRNDMRGLCGPPARWDGDNSQHRLHFLDNDEVIIDSVRFLGCTLWTNFELFRDLKLESMLDGESCLNDFRLIRNGEWYFSAQDSINLHHESVQWLTAKLKHTPYEGKTVVISHHAPSYQSVVPRYANNLLSACFASRLDHLLGASELWLHGHMHDSLDYVQNGTRVVCNPRGYCRHEGGCENDDFDPKLILEI